jgi:signal transduction histidine kinase
MTRVSTIATVSSIFFVVVVVIVIFISSSIISSCGSIGEHFIADHALEAIVKKLVDASSQKRCLARARVSRDEHVRGSFAVAAGRHVCVL